MITADTTAADLLAYVVTHPGEMDCRLVYADLLEERGEDARAEFIRVQCELAAWGDASGADLIAAGQLRRYDALRQRERELLEEHWLNWYTPVAADTNYCANLYPGSPSLSPSHLFRRGFVEQVTLTAEAFAGGPCGRCEGKGRIARRVWPRGHPLQRRTCPDCRGTGRTPGHAAALFRAAPIREVRLSDREPEIGASNHRGLYWWTNRTRNDCLQEPSDLPDCLYDLLPHATPPYPDKRGIRGGSATYSYSRRGAGFLTRPAAEAALAAAALLLGRRASWPCESCAGTGRLNSRLAARARWPELSECPACAGTGHAATLTPAPAAAP